MKRLLILALVLLCLSHAQTHDAIAQTPAASTPNMSATPAATTTTAAASATPTASPDASAPVSASPAPETTQAAKLPATKGALVLPVEKASPAQIPRFEKPPVIDGKLDDDVWKQARVLKDFYQIDPGDNSPPSKPTQVLLGYDAKTLYIAFIATDEPDKVRATVPRRDQIFNDDYVGFFLDTFNDKRRAYCIFFSPLGVQADGILTEGTGEDYSVDIVMDSKGTLTETGFTVEVAIPFKSLRYEAGKDKLWGAHFFRRIKRFNNELDSWMPFSRDVRGNLNQAGKLTGLEGIATERTIELIPSIAVSESGRRVRAFSIEQREAFRAQGLNPADPGRLVNEPLSFDPGLTAKFGITPQMTLDLAVNPDFAQVEADQLVVTANQRFPIFYAERRPFFLEGIEIFQTRIRAVHTRAIVDPDMAVKLTGKQGRNTFGLIAASDNGPGNFIGDDRLNPNNLKFLDQNATIGVLRLKRDIGKENSLGLIATTYNFIDKHNDVAGIDGRFKWDKVYLAEFQVLGTRSKRPFFSPERGVTEDRTGNALAYFGVINRSTRNWFFEFSGQGRTRDYRADVGFVQRNNINVNGLYAGYFSTPKEKARLISWYVTNFQHTDYDFQGRMQIWESEIHLGLNFRKQGYMDIGYERGYERLLEEEFGARREARPCLDQLAQSGTRSLGCGFFGESAERASDKNHFFWSGGVTPSKKYSFNGYANYRMGHMDLDFGAGRRFPRVSPSALLLGGSGPRDPGRGGLVEIGANFNHQPTNALRTTLSFTKNRLKRYDTDRVAFDDNIISLRTQYQFTKFLFARARVDYTTLSANVKAQALFGWTPSPGTALYIGYNDDMNRNGFNPFINDQNILEPGFRRNNRYFFIKTSYLIRKSF
ncbi:MAG TPA: DUF5916 domain-containing protein [Pyrinomonadaceae bacterium]|nr:DUF5916 domain-containing protein [Pyrinomonadaceae bacterium]